METESCSDRHDIAEVLVRYATGIDRRNWMLFRTCFTEDVHADYEGIGTWSGVDEISTFMTETHAAMGHTMHRLSNFAIEVAGDTATARTYVDAIIMSADGQGGVNALGLYDDNLVRTNDGWRIAQRHFTTVHASAVDRGLEIS